MLVAQVIQGLEAGEITWTQTFKASLGKHKDTPDSSSLSKRNKETKTK